MTYFADLTIYSYYSSEEVDGVYNVGWLDSIHEFKKGHTHGELIRKLAILALRKSSHQMRGFHYCEFCSDERIWISVDTERCLLGSAEIWIPAKGNGEFYAAPDMIIHYIEQHGYKPPEMYLDALNELDIEKWHPPE